MNLPEPIGPKIKKLLLELHEKKLTEKKRTEYITEQFGLSHSDAQACHEAYHKVTAKEKRK